MHMCLSACNGGGGCGHREPDIGLLTRLLAELVRRRGIYVRVSGATIV